ncbi:hypothetical protein QJ857_gp0040 [Tupanvirus soda lake]|uniref:Ankyrin repeat protein n=2 Tax=Tupanvirus TaxID=2094720 RepID=A0A6N1NPD6_9VIRU|nr:hypothetical protein QJ857_gp0040 [Tupanvirus soda lake]QKU34687.1 hypothetical protein [Tupanvirus soda lake]
MEKYIELLLTNFGKNLKKTPINYTIFGIESILFSIEENKYFNAIELLLHNHFPKEFYCNLLNLSIRFNNIKAITLLVNHGAQMDAYLYSSAINWCDLSVLELLLESDTNLHPQNDLSLALITAVKKCCYDKVLKLLKYGIPIDCCEAPLLISIKYNYDNITNLLINCGVNIDFGYKDEFYHIFYIASGVRYGINANKIEKNLPLAYAVSLGRNKIICLLMQNGTIVDSNVKEGFDMACTMNYFDTVKLILESGYNIVGDGEALNICVAYDSVNMIKLLIKHGAVINDNIHLSLNDPYHQKHKYNCLKILFDHGLSLSTETAIKIIHKCIEHRAFSSLELILIYMETNGNTLPSTIETYFDDIRLLDICNKHMIEYKLKDIKNISFF